MASLFTIEDLRRRPAPAKRHRFVMSFNGFTEDENTIEIPSEYIESVSMPGLVFDQHVVTVQSRTAKYVSYLDTTPMTVQFYEDEKYTISSILQRWRNLVRNPSSGTFGYPSVYKKDAFIYVFNNAGNPVTTFRLEEVFPLSTDPIVLDGSSSERVTVTQVFSVDAFEVIVQTGADVGLSASR